MKQSSDTSTECHHIICTYFCSVAHFLFLFSAPFTDNFILIADSIGRDIYMLSTLNSTDIRSCPLQDGEVPLGLAFDPFNNTVLYLEGGSNELRRTSLNGSVRETIFNFGAGSQLHVVLVLLSLLILLLS